MRAMERFHFFPRFLFETRAVISSLCPGRQLCSFPFFIFQEKKSSLPESGTTLHLIISSPSRHTYLMVAFEDFDMEKMMDLTRHAGFTGNPITSIGKNLPRVGDSVFYSLQPSIITQLFVTHDRQRNWVE